MTEIWALAALWLGLAFIAALFAVWFRVSTALTEIIVGMIAGLLLSIFVGPNVLGTDLVWVKFLAGLGAIVLTFLAGAELDPIVFRKNWKEATAVGLIGFFAPFFGCAAVAYWVLGWSVLQSWLAGVALSTTSVAVVYAVMLEYGFNKTDYGKVVLAACFINDLGTVLALGFIFAPFTMRTFIFAAVAIAVFAVLPWLTPRLFKLYGNRPSELEAKYLLLILFGLGALAAWAESEAVLPAYIVGMVLAGTVGKDHALIRRLRTLTLGLFDSILLPSRGFLRFDSHSDRGTTRLHRSSLRQDGDQVRWRVSGDQGLWCSAKGSDVHDLADVDRPDLRYHLGAVRPLARHYRPGAILCGRGRRRRQCCCSHADCQRLLLATSPVAAGGSGGGRDSKRAYPT